jgi:hypothetical protein
MKNSWIQNPNGGNIL